MSEKQIRRKIVKVHRHMNRGWQKSVHTGGSYTFDLECGHTHGRKISGGIPKTMTVRCDSCMSRARGSVETRGTTRETWDPIKQWPVRTEIQS